VEFGIFIQNYLPNHRRENDPDAEHHDEPNMISVNSGDTRELIWHFADAGTVYYACPLPGHFKGMNFPGMKGTINVEAK